MRLLFFVVFFLLLGAFFIISNQNIKINNEFDFSKFTKSYYFWVSGIFDNLAGITGDVVNSEWLPSNNLSENTSSNQIK
jgi:hypothetical protein